MEQKMSVSACWSTVKISAAKIFDGGLLSVGGEYFVRFLTLILLVSVWRALGGDGADLGGFTLPQLLSYTLMASVLRQQLDIISPATSALWEGSIIGRFTRPMPILATMVCETVGRWWVPIFFLYSLPVWLLAAPLLGIRALPATAGRGLLALASLLLGAAIGFALDFLFSALAIRMKNGCWAAMQIRESVFSLLSGAVIPFRLLPGRVGEVFALLPFGSAASAPLSIYVGLPGAGRMLLLQLFWAAVLWPLAIVVFRRAQERMVSFGG